MRVREPLSVSTGRAQRNLPLAILLVVAAAGCPGGGAQDGGGGVQGSGGGGRGGVTQPLGDPPPADPAAPGASYIGAVYERFRPAWSAFLEDCRTRLPRDHVLNDPTLEVLLAVSIDRSGKVVEVGVGKKSGIAAFDEAAVEVVREARPLPAPPRELVSDDDRVHLEWLFARDRRQAGPATASLRRVEWPLERAVPKLVAAGRVAEAAQRVAAAVDRMPPDALLSRFREVCIGALGRALGGKDSAAQVAAIDGVAAARVSALAPSVREVARTTVEPQVRRAALRALAQVGDREAIGLLRENALGTGSPEDRGAAAAALAMLGAGAEVEKAAHTGLKSSDENTRWSALVVMAHVAVPAAVPDLRALLGGSSRAARAERMASAMALGAVAAGSGEPARAAMAALVDCLGVSDAAQRAACAMAVAAAAENGARSRTAYSRLTGLLRDRDEQVRAAAALSAARLEPARFARDMGALAREKSDPVLAAMAEGLGGVPGGEALARLGKLATSGSGPVRLAAAEALARRPDADQVLAGLIDHPDPAVRAIAVRRERRPDVLRAQLAAEAPEVRAAALAALVAQDGAGKHVVDAARLFAKAPDASAESAAIARAWLAP
ncbi:MAG TPA: TonB family protein [Kofleriaceae bacterium]|nr:TonB family protein [Kofleriaceae bacterium]